MSLAVMPIRRVPWAWAGPVGESGNTRARSRMTRRLMTILLGDEVAAGSVAGGHGVERGRGGRARLERDRAPRREGAAERQRGQVGRRAGDRDERAALLTAAHSGLHQAGGVGMRGAAEQVADGGLL